jgi:hypothetical protein
VSQAAQPNITSVGTLTGLTVSGILSAGLYVGNASGLSNLNSSNLVGNVANANVALVVSQAAQPNITSVGTLTGLTVSGILSAGLYVGNASGLSNLNSSNLVGNVANANVALVVSQAAQPNITSVGLLSNLAVSNSVTTTNLFATNGLDVGPGTLGSNVVIFSNVSGGSNVFVMDSNSNVGIGTGAPIYKLDVSGQIRASRLALNQNPSYPSFDINLPFNGRIGSSGADRGNLYFPNTGFEAALYGQVIRFHTDPSGTISTERMQITSTGLVGINTTTPTSNLHVQGNVYVSNAVTTTNVFAATETLTGTTGATTLNITGNVYASNAVTTTNVFAITATVPGFTSQFTVNGGGTVTWSAAGYLLWSGRVLVIPAWRNAAYAAGGYWEINCPTSGTIISNGGTVTCTAAGIPVGGWYALYYRVVPGSANSSVQANFLLKDWTDTTYSPDSNWILLAVRNGDSGEIKWMPGNTTIPLGGTFYTPSASYDKVQVAGTVVVDSARTGIFANLYSANALSTTNVFSTTANVGTLNVSTISNLNSLVLLNNLYASNSLSTTNVFVDKGLDVGPGTLGSNVVIFSNASGGANTFVMDSNGRVTIGSTYTGGSLLSFGQAATTPINKIITLYDGNSAENPVSSTNFSGFGIGGNVLRYQVADTSTRHVFFGGSSEYARITSTGISILTGAAPNANLHVAGNIYASNALSTTNLLATTANLTTANATTILATTANIVTANATTIYAANSVTTTNLVTAGFTSNSTNTTFNFDTITIPFINSTTLNVASFANVQTQTIQGSSGQASLIVTGNIYASNALSTANAYLTGTLNVQGTSNLSVANIANIYTTNIVGFVGSQWTGSTGSPIYYVPQVGVGTSVTTANLTVTGNIYASNSIQTGNLILGGVTSGGFLQAQGTANVASVSTIPIGSGGTNQTSYGTTGGVVYYDGTRFQAASGVRASTATTLNVTTANITTLQTNSFIPASSGLFMNLNASYTLTAGASWTGSIAGTITSNLYTLFAPIPGITGWDAYGSSAFVNAPTANGGIKFNQPGPYMITAVISADNDIKTIALSSNTADVHSNVTNVWSYCYRFGVGTNPSIPAIIPVNVTDTTKYYYIDYETTSQTDTIHRTAYTNTSAEAYTGSYVIIRPV